MGIKNVKQIAKRAKSHLVRYYGKGVYEVISGTSGACYRVEMLAEGGASCSCEWGKYHTKGDKRVACSHVQAVYQWKADEEGRRVSAYGTLDEAKRQHGRTLNLGDGVYLTSRKAA